MNDILSFFPHVVIDQPGNALWAVPVLGALGLSWWFSIWSRRRSFRQYGNESIVSRFSDTPNVAREARVIGLTALAMLFISLATMMPYTPAAPVTVSAGSLRVVGVFDSSISMAAEDDRDDMPSFGGTSCAGVAGACGSRMDIAKAIMAKSLMPALKGNQLALEVYSGAPVVKSYLTDDFEPLTTLLGDWKWVDIGSAQGNGSYVADGLATAMLVFDHDKVAMNSPGNIVVLFTDGGHDDKPEDLKKATDELQKRGIRLIIIGVGSTKDAQIPMYKDDGTVSGYFPGGNEAPETTARDDKFLDDLARDTGGEYIRANPGQPLNISWPTLLAGSKVVVAKVYLYQYPLGLGMFLLCLVFFRHLPTFVRSLRKRVSD